MRSRHDQDRSRTETAIAVKHRESVGIQAQPHTALCVRETDGSAGAKDLEVLERAIGCLVAVVKGTLPVAGCREEVVDKSGMHDRWPPQNG